MKKEIPGPCALPDSPARYIPQSGVPILGQDDPTLCFNMVPYFDHDRDTRYYLLQLIRNGRPVVSPDGASIDMLAPMNNFGGIGLHKLPDLNTCPGQSGSLLTDLDTAKAFFYYDVRQGRVIPVSVGLKVDTYTGQTEGVQASWDDGKYGTIVTHHDPRVYTSQPVLYAAQHAYQEALRKLELHEVRSRETSPRIIGWGEPLVPIAEEEPQKKLRLAEELSESITQYFSLQARVGRVINAEITVNELEKISFLFEFGEADSSIKEKVLQILMDHGATDKQFNNLGRVIQLNTQLSDKEYADATKNDLLRIAMGYYFSSYPKVPADWRAMCQRISTDDLWDALLNVAYRTFDNINIQLFFNLRYPQKTP